MFLAEECHYARQKEDQTNNMWQVTEEQSRVISSHTVRHHALTPVLYSTELAESKVDNLDCENTFSVDAKALSNLESEGFCIAMGSTHGMHIWANRNANILPSGVEHVYTVLR